MKESGVKEGKIELSAEYDGLLKIDKEKLVTVNSFGRMTEILSQAAVGLQLFTRH